jgi:hypothetical protein
MKFALYSLGGFLLWLGGYSYLKTRGSMGMRPTGAMLGVYSFLGVCAELLVIPYLIAMGYLFSWWTPFVFAVVVGLLVGFIYDKVAAGATGLAILATPIGIVLVAVALLIPAE